MLPKDILLKIAQEAHLMWVEDYRKRKQIKCKLINTNKTCHILDKYNNEEDTKGVFERYIFNLLFLEKLNKLYMEDKNLEYQYDNALRFAGYSRYFNERFNQSDDESDSSDDSSYSCGGYNGAGADPLSSEESSSSEDEG